MKYYLPFILLLSLPYCAYSSHFFGGELYYECLDNDTFKISMIVYQNCGESNDTHLDFDPASKLHIFDANNNVIYSQNMPHVELALDTLAIPSFDSCKLIPENVCIHYRIRSTKVILPFTEGGYTATFQKCCLGEEITNVLNPDQIGINLNIHISEQALINCNNSPQFQNQSPGFFCQGVEFDFSHSALDPDGDSLVYKLIIPSRGPDDSNANANPPLIPPFQNLELLENYNEENLFGSNSIYQINNITGTISGIAQDTGLYMVGVSVSDFRNGQLQSQTTRILVYSINECKPSIVSKFEFEKECSGNIVQFINQSENATNYCWDFQTSTDCQFDSPLFEFHDEAEYFVTLIAEPNHGCTDTSEQIIYIEKPCGFEEFGIGIAIHAESIEICSGELTQLFVPLCENYTYFWTPSSGLSQNNIHNPVVKPQESTIYEVEIFNGDSCIWNSEIEISVLENCNKPILEVPNIFTPNNDGLNDSFGILSTFYFEEFDLKIFSRWGELVFHSDNINEKWNGMYKNRPAISEVYVWVLEYTYMNQNKLVKEVDKGDVSLVW